MTKPEPSEEDLRGRGGPFIPWFLKNCSNMSSNGVPLGRSGSGFGALVLYRLRGGDVDDGFGDLRDQVGEPRGPGLREHRR